MTPDTVPIAPIVALLQPYLVAIVTAVAPLIVVWGLSAFSRWSGAKIDATYISLIEGAAATQAGNLVAGALGNLATAQVTVNSPGVAAAANALIAATNPVLAKAVAATGLTPALAAQIIVGKIGELQAQMTYAPPAVPAPAK